MFRPAQRSSDWLLILNDFFGEVSFTGPRNEALAQLTAALKTREEGDLW